MDPITHLLDGLVRFRANYFHKEPGLYQSLAKSGQAPQVAVVACCDSRVDPALIFDCEPGDLFTIRNVANLVPPFEPSGSYHGVSAALEFAVRGLAVQHIVVLGHAQCGGIRALLADSATEKRDFISAWMNIAAEARERVLGDTSLSSLDERARCCEQMAIGVSLKNLLTFSWIRERVESGSLQLHGWYFDLESGDLLYIDANDEYQKITS